MEPASAEWELWYQDTFDRETPRQVEKSGRGLEAGLTELWRHHLSEMDGAAGQIGFAQFNLWLKREEKSIRIMGDVQGMVDLRRWLFSDRQAAGGRLTLKADETLLHALAVAHGRLIQAGASSEVILELATQCKDRDEFEKKLAGILPGKK